MAVTERLMSTMSWSLMPGESVHLSTSVGLLLGQRSCGCVSSWLSNCFRTHVLIQSRMVLLMITGFRLLAIEYDDQFKSGKLRSPPVQNVSLLNFLCRSLMLSHRISRYSIPEVGG